jgi:outer membrane lipoprotein-sorting protein
MDCNECKLEMEKLFDPNADKIERAEIMEHIKHCENCSIEYRRTKEVFTMLKPKTLPKAPLTLKQNIIHQLKTEETKMEKEVSKTSKISSRTKKFLSIAAVLVIIMMVIPIVDKNNLFTDSTAKAAGMLIQSSIKATRLIKSMVIKFKVRTVDHDNFALVGTNYDMVDHTIWKTFDKPEKWRVEKSGRVVVFDGQYQYLWVPRTEEAIKAERNANIIEWLQILLEPGNILMKEQNNSKDKGSKITMDEKNGEILLSVTSKAQGNFINDYCKNRTIEESDNRREYKFDGNSKLLKGLKIFILDSKKETLILEIENIDYNVNINPSLFTMELPAGAEWRELTQNYNSSTFKNIGSKRTAELFFEGLANNNWALVEEACDFFKNKSDKVEKIKERFGGLKVIRIGEPFKSGLYPGEFVPYEIKLKSGETKKFNLAVRNDNPGKVWTVDGGF